MAPNLEQSSGSALKYASVAQLVEQWTENPRVVGSIPTGGTKLVADVGIEEIRFRRSAPINAGVAHPVERHLAKVEVASSSLVTRSRIKKLMRWHWLLLY